MNVNARRRTCGLVVFPLFAAALAWSPAAHAAGSTVSLPATTPAVSTQQVVSTAGAVAKTVAKTVPALPIPKSPVTTATSSATEKLRRTVKTVATAAAAHVAPATRSATKSHARPKPVVRPPRSVAAVHLPTRASRRPARASTLPAAVRDRVPSSAMHRSAARPLVASPTRAPMHAPSSGMTAGGMGSGFIPPFLALAAVLLAAVAPGRGRRILPSVTDGRGCALTLDLERPD